MADLGNLAQGLNAGVNSGVDTFVKLKQLGLVEQEQKRKEEQAKVQADMSAAEINFKIMSNKNMPKSMRKAAYLSNKEILTRNNLVKPEQMPDIDEWEDHYDDFAKKAHGIYQSVQKGDLPFEKGMEGVMGVLTEAQDEHQRKIGETLKGQLENYGVGKIAQEYAETGKQWTPEEVQGAVGQAMQIGGTKGAEEIRKTIKPESNSLVGKVNPKDFTQASFKHFLQTGDYSVLVPLQGKDLKESKDLASLDKSVESLVAKGVAEKFGQDKILFDPLTETWQISPNYQGDRDQIIKEADAIRKSLYKRYGAKPRETTPTQQPTPATTQKPSGKNKEQILMDAQLAIQQGADKQKVLQRLKEMGVIVGK